MSLFYITGCCSGTHNALKVSKMLTECFLSVTFSISSNLDAKSTATRARLQFYHRFIVCLSPLLQMILWYWYTCMREHIHKTKLCNVLINLFKNPRIVDSSNKLGHKTAIHLTNIMVFVLLRVGKKTLSGSWFVLKYCSPWSFISQRNF